MSPLCESFVPPEAVDDPEVFYPLHAFVCGRCFLVQLDEFVAPDDIFTEYAYFSSFSDSWLAHARRYVDDIADRLGLDGSSQVVELASNDGYLLQYVVQRGIPALGIEPAANVAKAAEARGVPTIVEFFGRDLAARLVDDGVQADLVVGNNVLAQVPDLNDFLGGIATLLKPDGVVTLEFPHLERLVAGRQFDTIYHEHFSYFSLGTTHRMFAAHGLTLFDVEELPTHGGSLRVYAQREQGGTQPVTDAVHRLLAHEREIGLERLEYYRSFADDVTRVRLDLLDFLIGAKRAGKRVAGYGAPGKGNTLLNYCGIRSDLVEFTVDRNAYKHGRFLPGTRIPVHDPAAIAAARPDYVLILPWNLKDEIVEQMAGIAAWGGQFVVAIPELQVLGGPEGC